MGKIKIELGFNNIAPLVELNERIEADSIKYGIYANNGSGKTFMSRMFRLTEKDIKLEIDENGKSTTDNYITRGESEGEFKLAISDETGTKEEFEILLRKHQIPIIPATNYLYHTFNQDYVDDNIKNLNFDKDSNIEGFILGKINIDIEEEETKLKDLLEKNLTLTSKTAEEITNYVDEKIKPLRDIARIKEFSFLTPSQISKENHFSDSQLKSLEELFDDYEKIKSIPESLSHLKNIDAIEIDKEFIDELIKDCKEEFSLSKIAEEFKKKVKSKQDFIETGLSIMKENECPFCEQTFSDKASHLIDEYNKYITDRESQTLKRFGYYSDKVDNIISSINSIQNESERRNLEFESYIAKYIPSLEDKGLLQLDLDTIKQLLLELKHLIQDQQKDISVSIDVLKDYNTEVSSAESTINKIIEANNNLIKELNSKISKASDENLEVRRKICKATFLHLKEKHQTDFQEVVELRKQIKELQEEIRIKKEQQKVNKKEKVAETIKTVLNHFFSSKYSLDVETFRLTFNQSLLEEKEARHVLSEGEKTIVAFAYFIGDTHLKIDSEDDYKKLFFVIDDPISSMDFDHVYTLCGVIRDLKLLIDKIERERLLILTHNNEFMRVLSHHGIINTRLILKNGKLKKFNINSTAPYINHLLDIVKIANRIDSPSHTTANSIRHIVETLTKFDQVILQGEGIKNYLIEKLPQDKRSCILINDLSHGGYRTEQPIITEDEYIEMCKDIVNLVKEQFEGQITYCEKLIESE